MPALNRESDRARSDEPNIRSSTTRPTGLMTVVAGLLLVAAAFAAYVIVDRIDQTGDQAIASSPATAVPQPAADDQPSTSRLLNQFATAWVEGDWTNMRTLSNDTVVGTAQGWPDVDDVQRVGDGDTTSGTLLIYLTDGGHALVFTYTIDDLDGEPTITALTFAGDAG